MLVEEVTTFFRFLAQEPSVSTLMTPANIELMLKSGYRRFRHRVMTIDPWFYAVNFSITLTAAHNGIYSLNTAPTGILGPSNIAPAGRLERLVMVYEPDSDGLPAVVFTPVYSRPALLMANKPTVALLGQSLFFWESVVGDISVVYVPEHSVDFDQAAQTAGANEYIDDLNEYHELIAYYALDLYEGADGAASQKHAMLRQQLEVNLAAHLEERNAAPASVQPSLDDPWEA